jgi:tRNA(Ile)-lysidine synthase
VPDTLFLRGRRPGDRFRPLGMGGDVKLQDYFVNRRVPEPVRDAVPLVTAAGMILWVVGHAPAARAAVTGTTREIVEIAAHDAD